MAGNRSNVQEDVRFRVLRLLEENPEMSQRDIAASVGISVGGVHYLLNALIGKGMVQLGNFSAARDKRTLRKGRAHIPFSQTQDGRVQGARGRN